MEKLNHPFIVKIKEKFEDTNYIYVVMEYIQGGEIQRLMEQEDIFPNDVCLFYLAEVLETL